MLECENYLEYSGGYKMFWLKTGVLSDKQIRGLMGKKVFIHPFSKYNLKGATYNLTASIVAKSVNTDKLLINQFGQIEIPVGDTALIQTEESIFVEKDICGTYHSKVKLVSKGLAHISTTLDPLYFGTSLIAIHNYSNKNYTIKVGESFVSLMLHKMPTSTKLLHDNPAFRQDLIDMNFNKDSFLYTLEEEQRCKILEEIENWKEQQWRIEKEYLIEKVHDVIKDQMKSKRYRYVDIVVIGLTIATVLTLLCLISKGDIDNKYFTVVSGFMAAILPIFMGIGAIVKNHIRGE